VLQVSVAPHGALQACNAMDLWSGRDPAMGFLRNSAGGWSERSIEGFRTTTQNGI